MAVDFNYYLNRKYTLLQQQADAGTKNVDIAAKNAATNALAAGAAARVDNTRADLMPAESAAGIAKTGAETSLLGEQARYFGPVAEANIANTNAGTYLTGIQGDVAKREGLMERSILPESLAAVMGTKVPSFRLGAPVAPTRSATPWYMRGATPLRRFPGDVTAEELDRLNGL
jgi:hypothetical protein